VSKQQAKVPIAIDTAKERPVRIGRIGPSKLQSPEIVAEAQAGVNVLAPELLSRYEQIALALADPTRVDWDEKLIVSEFDVLAEAICATGSVDPSASPVARRAREVICVAAGKAMYSFPRTLMGVTYLVNHSLEIGLLRKATSQGETRFTVELPRGNVRWPKFEAMVCSFEKTTELMATYMAMAADAKQHEHLRRQKKMAELQAESRQANFLEIIEAGVGDTVIKVPNVTPPTYLKLRFNEYLITVVDAIGSELAEYLGQQGFWITVDSIKEDRFRNRVMTGITPEQKEYMVKLKDMIQNALVVERRKAANRQGTAAEVAVADVPLNADATDAEK
jgi:hypothetical protein